MKVGKFVSWCVICESMRARCLGCGPVECDAAYLGTSLSDHGFLSCLSLYEADFLLRN